MMLQKRPFLWNKVKCRWIDEIEHTVSVITCSADTFTIKLGTCVSAREER